MKTRIAMTLIVLTYSLSCFCINFPPGGGGGSGGGGKPAFLGSAPQVQPATVMITQSNVPAICSDAV